MCIRMYERHREHDRHIENHEIYVIGFQEIWGRREIK